MGRKVHPMGFRIGIIRDWQARWYADKHYASFLHADLKLRQAIQSKYSEAGISLLEIDRQANKVTVTIHTSRPGIVIGRGGQRVDEMRQHLESLVGKGIQLNIQEIRQPELDAYLVARVVAEQMERRIAYRRAMKQSMFRTMQAGAKGVKISCAGRLGGVEIARRETMHQGQVPLHTLRADIDYGFTEAHTTLGRIGVKVWIYKGDILPEPKVVEVEEKPAELIPTSPEAKVEEAEEKPAELIPTSPEPKVEEVEEKPAEVIPISPEPEVEEVEEKPAELIPTSPEVETEPEDKNPEPAQPAPTQPEEKDVTTQASEIPKEP